MRLSVIVPVRDDAVRLAKCLASLDGARQADTDAEVIVADNGSTDDSAQVARKMGARVLSLPGLTVPALRNAAAGEATGDLLAFVDADHELAPGWMAAAFETMADESVGAAGARYTSPPEGTWVQEMYRPSAWPDDQCRGNRLAWIRKHGGEPKSLRTGWRIRCIARGV